MKKKNLSWEEQESLDQRLFSAAINFKNPRKVSPSKMRYLIRKGANVHKIFFEKKLIFHVCNNLHATAKHWFWRWKNFRVIKVLIKAGVDVNDRDSSMNTPLILSANGSHFNIVKYLVKKGALINEKNNDGTTPIITMDASTRNNEKSLLFLIKNGADLNAKQNEIGIRLYGWTSLMYAAERGDFKTVKLLINYGADITVKDMFNKTVLDYALENGNENIIGLISKKNCR